MLRKILGLVFSILMTASIAAQGLPHDAAIQGVDAEINANFKKFFRSNRQQLVFLANDAKRAALDEKTSAAKAYRAALYGFIQSFCTSEDRYDNSQWSVRASKLIPINTIEGIKAFLSVDRLFAQATSKDDVRQIYQYATHDDVLALELMNPLLLTTHKVDIDAFLKLNQSLREQYPTINYLLGSAMIGCVYASNKRVEQKEKHLRDASSYAKKYLARVPQDSRGYRWVSLYIEPKDKTLKKLKK